MNENPTKEGLVPGEVLPKIFLNSTEFRLKCFLLDVAQYIDKKIIKEKPISRCTKSPSTVIRFTGGWVRDKLLGLSSQDIDVAINNMTGYEFGKNILEFISVHENSLKYGFNLAPEKLHKIDANPDKSKHLETTTIKLFNVDVDFVNLRRESYSESSRNPIMEFGTPEEDAARRDATVNALFYNLNTSSVEDFTRQGLQDLESGTVRTPLDPVKTFKDDPLRVLRLIRFACKLDFAIEVTALEAMTREDVQQALRVKISRERIGIELEKIFKGPNARLAFELIHKQNLYLCIFNVSDDFKASLSSKGNDDDNNNKARDVIKYEYNLKNWSSVYRMADRLANLTDASPHYILKRLLFTGEEERYLAWIMVAMTPWIDAGVTTRSTGSKGNLTYSAIVAREGFRATNKVSDLLNMGIHNLDHIHQTKDRCFMKLRGSYSFGDEDPGLRRETIGMAIRRWGSTWRSQVLLSLFYDVLQDLQTHETILQSYSMLIQHAETLGVLNVYTEKPIINGRDLCSLMSTKPGSWVSGALDVVMEWQLGHPDIINGLSKEEILQQITSYLGGADLQNLLLPQCALGELRFNILKYLLENCIRNAFSQSPITGISRQGRPSKHNSSWSNYTMASDHEIDSMLDESVERKIRPWKFTESYTLELLLWVLRNIHDGDNVEKLWPNLIPPIFSLLQDRQVKYKQLGCTLSRYLLEKTQPGFLAKVGLSNLFYDSLVHCLTFLPTLTPLRDSIDLLTEAYPALIQLFYTIHQSTINLSTSVNAPLRRHSPSLTLTPRDSKLDLTKSGKSPTFDPPLNSRSEFLDNLVQSAIIIPYQHAGDNVEICSLIMENACTIICELQIESVKHLTLLMPIIMNQLCSPFILADLKLVNVALKLLQEIFLNAWPRIPPYKFEILKTLGTLWLRISDDLHSLQQSSPHETVNLRLEKLSQLQHHLHDCVELFSAAMRDDLHELPPILKDMYNVEPRLKSLFGKLYPG